MWPTRLLLGNEFSGTPFELLFSRRLFSLSENPEPSSAPLIPCTGDDTPCIFTGPPCIEMAQAVRGAEVGLEDPREWLTSHSRSMVKNEPSMQSQRCRCCGRYATC